MSLLDLFDTTADIASRDEIYALIAAGELHVDLRSKSLMEPKTVPVFRNEAEWQSSAPGLVKPSIASESMAQETAAEVKLRKANEQDLAMANNRLHHVLAHLKKTPQPTAPVPARTLRRWVAAYRAAEISIGNGYVGLLPEPRRGNTTPKLPEESRTIMSEFIASDYESLKQKTKYAS